MAIPDFQTTMRPLLEAVNDNQVHQFRDVIDNICEHFDLTPEEQQQKISSGKQTVIHNRLSWARSYLTKAGLLVSPARGLTQITPRGVAAIAQVEQPIRNNYLKQFPEFREFQAAKSKAANDAGGLANNGGVGVSEVDSGADADSQSTPEEQLEQIQAKLNSALAQLLLSTIKTATPIFFEQLVVDLMIAMGYGGSRKEAGLATQFTADGGIDGIIKEDPLGLELIYLQAKRYTDATIGRPDLQKFAGALDMQRAKKGVFITTTTFSKEAREFAAMIEKRIILIDGAKLTMLMIEHDLGVNTAEIYTIKQLDSGYFSEE